VSSEGSQREFRLLEDIIICIAAVLAVWAADGARFVDPSNSRLATVYALTHHGTWYIDRPLEEAPIDFEQRTIDKVFVKGRWLSSKPPILPLLMTGEYLVLRETMGWTLADEEETHKILRTMVITLVGGGYVLLLIFFRKTLTLLRTRSLVRVVLLLSLAFGTLLWGYVYSLNNHIPGAACATVSLYYALGMASSRLTPSWWRFALFGLFSALTFAIDMPGAIFPATAGAALLVRQPRRTLTWALAGAAVVLLPHFAVTYATTGSLLPVQMRPALYQSEPAYWRDPIGVDALSEPKGVYLFHMTLGRVGLFSLFPIHLAGLAGLMYALVNRSAPWRTAAFLGGLSFFLLTLYYAVGTNNYGGVSYGFRWYIVASPVLLLMAAPLLDTLRARWKWLFVGVMVAISFYSAWEASLKPWSVNREWTCRILGPTV
jgi:hypothetical protein